MNEAWKKMDEEDNLLNKTVALNLKGRNFEKLGNYEKAIKCYEKVVSFNDLGMMPYERLTIIYRKLERHEDEYRILKLFCELLLKEIEHRRGNPTIWNDSIPIELEKRRKQISKVEIKLGIINKPLQKEKEMDKFKTSITCPKCKVPFTVAVETMIPGTFINCPNQQCGHKMEFTGDDGRNIQKSLDDFNGLLKNFGKDINIRL